jgi:CheY-like chemotaxis protein
MVLSLEDQRDMMTAIQAWARETCGRAATMRREARLAREASVALRRRAAGTRAWARVTAATCRQAIVIAGGADVVQRRPGRTRVVLVVDDHDDTRQMYMQFLEAMGIRTLEATTCAEAVAKSQQGGLDAIVLDRQLPDGDGGSLCRTLRTDPRTLALPVVVLSGRARDASLDGIDAYLLKPVLPERLLEELERLFDRRDGS